MAKTTGISFATATQNFWTGCVKVSPGCKFCYMYREKQGRFGNNARLVERAGKSKFTEPLRWKEPQTIFTCSWSDFYIKDADEWRADAWDVIRKTPQHFWIIITKRPERILKNLPPDWGKGWPNVIHIVSIEKQKNVKLRLDALLEVPGLRGVIAEPLLEEIKIEPYLELVFNNKTYHPIDWVIMGGESGNNVGDYRFRECRKEWLHSLVKQCQAAKVPVFVKQLGTALAKTLEFSKKDLHAGNIEDPHWPMYLRFQEFPAAWAHAPKGNDAPPVDSEDASKSV